MITKGQLISEWIMKSSFLPKCEQKFVQITALTTQGRNPDNFSFVHFGRKDDFINSFWNCLTFRVRPKPNLFLHSDSVNTKYVLLFILSKKTLNLYFFVIYIIINYNLNNLEDFCHVKKQEIRFLKFNEHPVFSKYILAGRMKWSL